MMDMYLWRIAVSIFRIERNWEITYNIMHFSPPGMSLPS
jgi:hypothetical protein